MSEHKNRKIEYLDKIESPKDFKNIPDEEMGAVAEEIRSELVRIVSKNGGHLSSNLGAVELTMAIHRVFDSPKDHIVFDVGHQSYVHKLLTGRYSRMDTLRESGGLCGFTNRLESEHDCFGAGHSSTSFSAALGFAVSDKLEGSDAYTVAVIGDGAYTGGMIHEALNNCRKDLNLIIILNENEMSISKNIGRFASNLSKLRTRSGYFKTKRATGAFLKKIPLIGKYLFKAVLTIKQGIKNTLYGSNYFESMGLTYLGPIDGNDFEAVTRLLSEAKKLGESVLVHVKTVKGKGYSPAENAPDVYHGMSPDAKENECHSFSQSMGHIITELARDDEKICAITAAMCDGTGLCEFKDAHKDRFFDVGIAEEHALTFAAGLAANGMKPVVAIYSTFLQRGYDNIIHDIALQNLPVIMCVDRAGLNSRDGATHHGIFDVAFLSQIPNLKIYTPITYKGLEKSIKQALSEGVPSAIRYPNGYENAEVVAQFYGDDKLMALGAKRNFSANDKKDVVIVTHGRMVSVALAACGMLKEKGIEAGVILLEMLKPYDLTAETVYKLLNNKDCGIILLEEEIRSGGFGMNLRDKLVSLDGIDEKMIEIVATDDTFVTERPKGEHILKTAGVDAESVCKAAMKIINK